MNDLDAIRAAAPEWARWFCVSWDGNPIWQANRGDGRTWLVDWRDDDTYEFLALNSGKFQIGEPFAIHLPTGAVHLQQPDGPIVEVPREEWETQT